MHRHVSSVRFGSSSWTTATSPTARSTLSARSGQWSTSAAPSSAATSSRWQPACVPAAGCSTTALPGPPTASHIGQERSSTATCSPTGNCRGPEQSSPPCTITAWRYATTRTSGSTTPSLCGSGEPTLERHWPEVVAEVGERRARVWRLYMVGSRVGFERDRIQIHQMLGVRLDSRGRSNMRLRPTWEQPEPHASRRASQLAA